MLAAKEVAPDEFLRLIADSRRWRLLQELATSDLRVNELVDRLDSPQNLVSYHLRELRDAGLVIARRALLIAATPTTDSTPSAAPDGSQT